MKSRVTLEDMSLKGMIVADAKTQEPFVITVMGTLGGTEKFAYELPWTPWKPGKDEDSWFKALGGKIVEQLTTV